MLYLVPTPIGNLKDITLRALEILKEADSIYCEDKRQTQKLLTHFGITAKLETYHEHNAAKVRPLLLRALTEGKTVALVSDAGMPGISDPGFKLVQDCQTKGLSYSVLPGASAVLTALVASGLPSDQFIFSGFLPPKQTARKKALQELSTLPVTRIFFESPHRLVDTLQDTQEVYGDCEVVVCREISKMYEEIRRGPASQVQKHFEITPPKGEIVLVVEGTSKAEDMDVDALLVKSLEKHKTKEAVSLVAEMTGLPKKELYERALKLKDGN